MKRFIRYSLYFSFIIILNSCAFFVSKVPGAYTDLNTIEKGAIPPDIGDPARTLLIIKKGKDSYDRTIKSNVSNRYKGNYEIVSESDIDQEKYQDTDKYRYIFNSTTTIRSEMSTVNNPPRRIYITDYCFFFVDRKNKKTYSCNKKVSNLFEIRDYMKKLEAARLEFQSDL